MGDGDDMQAGFEDYCNMDTMPAHPSRSVVASAPVPPLPRRSVHAIDDHVPLTNSVIVPAKNVRYRDTPTRLRLQEEEIYESCYAYKAKNRDELSLRRGSVVRIVGKEEKGWLKVICDGKRGVVPEGYMKMVGKACMCHIKTDEIEFLQDNSIGEGASGSVYKVRYQNHNAAFKKRKMHAREGTVDKAQFEEEAKDSVTSEALHFSRFHHDNIVKLYGVVTDPPVFGMVLELCEGGMLSTLFKTVENAALPKRIIVDWAFQIASAMAEICSKLVHRDLKMDNVLVAQRACLCLLPNSNTPDRPNIDLYTHENIQMQTGVCSNCGGTALDRLQLKLTDFGLSRGMSEENDPTESKMLTAVGTTYTIAPEICKSRLYSEKSDVWSFGVILWELVTRKVPYDNVHSEIIPFLVASQRIQLVITDAFPKHLASIVKNCLQFHPNDRPTFKEIRRELALYLEELKTDRKEDDYIELKKLERELHQDQDYIKCRGITEEMVKKLYVDIITALQTQPDQRDSAPPVERNFDRKKIDKTNIGAPSDVQHIVSIKNPPGTLPKNIPLAEIYGEQHSQLHHTLSKSQPANLNQLHLDSSSIKNGTDTISRSRHLGVRRNKKERISTDATMHLGVSTMNGDTDSETSPFSLSYNGDSRTTESPSQTSTESENTVTDSPGKTKRSFLSKIFSHKPKHKRNPSIDSTDELSQSDIPPRSQSRSSSISTPVNTLLYNSSKLPAGLLLADTHRPAKSPDSRNTLNIKPTDQTRSFTKTPLSSVFPSSSTSPLSPAGRIAPTARISSIEDEESDPYKQLTPEPHSRAREDRSPNSRSDEKDSDGSIAGPYYAMQQRPKTLANQVPLDSSAHQHVRAPLSSSSPVGLDDLVPRSTLGPSIRLPERQAPALPPRRSKDHPPDIPAKRSGLDLSRVVPIEQHSPGNAPADVVAKHRSRTHSSSTTLESPSSSQSPHDQIAQSKGYMHFSAVAREEAESESTYVKNPAYFAMSAPIKTSSSWPNQPPPIPPPPSSSSSSGPPPIPSRSGKLALSK